MIIYNAKNKGIIFYLCMTATYIMCIKCMCNLQGPNHMWHIDGYDKLSPYGLTIHGCIDG